MDEISLIIINHSPHIIIISEANIHPNSHIQSLQFEGYYSEIDNKIMAKTRSNMIILIAKELKYKRRKDLEITKTPSVWLEVKPDKGPPILVNGTYREWSCQSTITKKNEIKGNSISNQKDRLTSLLYQCSKAATEDKMIIITGDWNIDMLAWNTIEDEQSTHNNNRKSLLDMVKFEAANSNLTLLTKRATRYQGADRPSALDIILSNEPDKISQITYHQLSSDHQAIKCKVLAKVPKPKQKTQITRTYKNYTATKCRNLASQCNLTALMASTDPNFIAEAMTSKIISILNTLAPEVKMTNRKNHAQLLTQETKDLMNLRNQQKLKANSTQNKDDRKLTK